MAEKNPFMMVVLGDFNAKSKSWYTSDNTNFEGLKIGFLTFSFSFYQIIKNRPIFCTIHPPALTQYLPHHRT